MEGVFGMYHIAGQIILGVLALFLVGVLSFYRGGVERIQRDLPWFLAIVGIGLVVSLGLSFIPN